VRGAGSVVSGEFSIRQGRCRGSCLLPQLAAPLPPPTPPPHPPHTQHNMARILQARPAWDACAAPPLTPTPIHTSWQPQEAPAAWPGLAVWGLACARTARARAHL
jgi:hypothetical protein